jgi:hypothetical protein
MHRVIRNVPAISYTLWSLVFPSRVSGQVAVTPASPTPMGGVVALGIMVGLLVLVGIGVKLYDLKRKREEQGVALQARLSDALVEDPELLEDPELACLPLATTVHVPFRRPAAAIVTVTGHVPAPELREAAIRIVRGKMRRTWPSARIEDRIVVDRHRMQHAAA